MINSQLRRYFNIIRQTVKYFIKFDKKNHIKTKREFKKFYRKSIEVLLKNISGNIKKEELKVKGSTKGNK